MSSWRPTLLSPPPLCQVAPSTLPRRRSGAAPTWRNLPKRPRWKCRPARLDTCSWPVRPRIRARRAGELRVAGPPGCGFGSTAKNVAESLLGSAPPDARGRQLTPRSAAAAKRPSAPALNLLASSRRTRPQQEVGSRAPLPRRGYARGAGGAVRLCERGLRAGRGRAVVEVVGGEGGGRCTALAYSVVKSSAVSGKACQLPRLLIAPRRSAAHAARWNNTSHGAAHIVAQASVVRCGIGVYAGRHRPFCPVALVPSLQP
eukprot:357951-Chlamydomonas_euryale.AAC.10